MNLPKNELSVLEVMEVVVIGFWVTVGVKVPVPPLPPPDEPPPPVGGVVGMLFNTVIVTGKEVVVLPARSRATATMV
jgi:hypothetical protein